MGHARPAAPRRSSRTGSSTSRSSGPRKHLPFPPWKCSMRSRAGARPGTTPTGRSPMRWPTASSTPAGLPAAHATAAPRFGSSRLRTRPRTRNTAMPCPNQLSCEFGLGRSWQSARSELARPLTVIRDDGYPLVRDSEMARATVAESGPPSDLPNRVRLRRQPQPAGLCKPQSHIDSRGNGPAVDFVHVDLLPLRGGERRGRPLLRRVRRASGRAAGARGAEGGDDPVLRPGRVDEARRALRPGGAPASPRPLLRRRADDRRASRRHSREVHRRRRLRGLRDADGPGGRRPSWGSRGGRAPRGRRQP